MKKSRLFALVLALMLIVSLAACGGQASSGASSAAGEPTAAPTADNSASGPSAEPAATEAPVEDTGIVYPIVADDLDLSIWGTFSTSVPAYQKTPDDCFGFQTAAEKTGVQISWTILTPPDANQKFPISIASGDMPDVYRCFPQWYPNLQDACDQDIIIELTDLCEENAPDYYAMLTADETRYLDGIDDNSKIFAVWHYASEYVAPEGISIRQDWLDELDMAAPADLAGIEAYLEAIKTEYGCAQALFLDNANYTGGGYWLAHAFNVGGYNKMNNADEFIQIDGQVKCSYTEAGFKDFVTKLHDWYEKGYISSDFASQEMDIVNNADNLNVIVNGQTGLIWARASGFGDYAALSPDEDFALVGVGNVNAVDGGKSHLAVTATRAVRYGYCITTACKNWDVALKWMNYFYTEEGVNLYNYGVEGVSWERAPDGGIRFNSDVENRVGFEDLTTIQTANYYSLYVQAFSFENPRRLFQFYDDAALAAVETWTASKDGAYTIPLGISMTSDESAAFNAAVTEIRTFVNEKIGLYILGQEDLANWDSFIATVQDLGVQDCIDAYQGALDRYYAR